MGAMNYLLDTHVLLWWLFDDRRLSARARAVLRDPSQRVLVSSASAWEISTKHRLGRLDSAAPLLGDFSGWLEKARFGELPITSSHAIRAGDWDVDHRDPFDRMLAAQSLIEGLRLVSRDKVFVDFGLDVLW
jgi:PIN domain nuclease of toxin-antitoxin system